MNTVDTLIKEKRYPEAIHLLMSEWQKGSKDPEVLYKLGEAYYLSNDLNTAIKFLEIAFKLDAENPKYSFLLGMAFSLSNQSMKAKSVWQKIPDDQRLYLADLELAQLDQENPKGNFGCSHALRALKKQPSVEVLIKFLSIQISSLRKRKTVSSDELESIRYYLNQLKSHDSSQSQKLSAAFFNWSGNLLESERCYRGYLSQNPNDEIVKYNFSQVLLSLGKYQEGYSLMNSRVNVHQGIGSNIDFAKSLGLKELDASNLDQVNGKDLVVVSEQGIGDQIWSMSFIRAFETTFKCSLTFYVSPKLATALSGHCNFTNAINSIEHLSTKIDQNSKWFISTASMFFLLNHVETNLHPVDRFVSYPRFSFQSDIKRHANTKRIGVSWKSMGSSLGVTKDLPLDFFNILLSHNVKLINCQYGSTLEEVACIEQQGFDVEHSSELDLFDSLADVYELVNSCDRVITCSNAVAHIAGSLGVPTFLAVNSPSVWYWKNVGISDWYSSVYVARKAFRDPWSTLWAELEEFLKSY